MTEITLFVDHDWVSPYVFTAYVALVEKGLEHDVVELDLGRGDHRGADYASRSLTARVPTLRHNDFWLSESQAIVEYLDDAFPGRPRLLPTDVRERARARQILAWIRSDLLPLREERPTTTMFYTPATAPMSERARAAADKLVRVAEALIPEGHDTLFATWSIADADLAFVLHRLILNHEAVPERIAAYAARHWQRPSVRRFVDRERPPLPRP